VLAIGGPVNRQRLPEVEVDPGFLLARMYEDVEIPSLDNPEFGGADPRRGLFNDLSDDDIKRIAAERLRDGQPLSGRPGPQDIYRLLELIDERCIDPYRLLARAAAANRENAELLPGLVGAVVLRGYRGAGWRGVREPGRAAATGACERAGGKAGGRCPAWGRVGPSGTVAPGAIGGCLGPGHCRFGSQACPHPS
jgi:hypothetical protein